MRATMRVLMLMTVAPLVLTGCMSFFYKDTSKQDAIAAAKPTGKLNSECARLQPLFASDGAELTRDQMNVGLKLELAKWDKDGSGDLTNSEVQPLNDELRAENVGASPVRDWNADGRIDEKEFGSGWRTMFELCDRNRNDMVSVRELGHSPNVAAPRTAPSESKKKPEGSSEQQGRPQSPGY
jgi:hypothetical protein